MPDTSSGDTFLGLTLTVPGGQTVQVPESFAGKFGVMLPCRAHGAPTATPDAPAIAALTGAFVNPDPVYPQSAGSCSTRSRTGWRPR